MYYKKTRWLKEEDNPIKKSKHLREIELSTTRKIYDPRILIRKEVEETIA
jgi:hypothetical protein